MLDSRLTVNPNLMEKPNTRKANDIQMMESGIRSLRSVNSKIVDVQDTFGGRCESTHNSDDYI